jgi:hypothetical protein
MQEQITAEVLRAKRLAEAESVGHHYRAISFHYCVYKESPKQEVPEKK